MRDLYSPLSLHCRSLPWCSVTQMPLNNHAICVYKFCATWSSYLMLNTIRTKSCVRLCTTVHHYPLRYSDYAYDYYGVQHRLAPIDQMVRDKMRFPFIGGVAYAKWVSSFSNFHVKKCILFCWQLKCELATVDVEIETKRTLPLRSDKFSEVTKKARFPINDWGVSISRFFFSFRSLLESCHNTFIIYEGNKPRTT